MNGTQAYDHPNSKMRIQQWLRKIFSVKLTPTLWYIGFNCCVKDMVPLGFES